MNESQPEFTDANTDYELIHKVYFNNLNDINERAEKSKFNLTNKILYRFYLKTVELAYGLVLFEDLKLFYASQGLARILDEHFLVAYYIWCKARTSKTDDCAHDYYEAYPLFEYMKQKNFDSRLDNSYDKKKTPLQNFLITAPESANLNETLEQADIDDINRRANQFDIRNILKYMQHELDQNDPHKSFQIQIHDICRKYNNRSTFVHGGRIADNLTFDSMQELKKLERLDENVTFGKMYSSQILLFIMVLLLLDDNSFFNTFKPIWETMKYNVDLNNGHQK